MVQPVKELTTFSPAPSPPPLSFPHSLTRLSYSSPLTQAWPAHPPPCTQARPPLPARSCIAASRSLSLFTPERGARVRALVSTLHVSSRSRIRLDDPDCLASHTRTRAASLRPHISLHSNNTPTPPPARCPPDTHHLPPAGRVFPPPPFEFPAYSHSGLERRPAPGLAEAPRRPRREAPETAEARRGARPLLNRRGAIHEIHC